MEEIRKAAVAGSFYPGEAKTLSRQIREFLSLAPRTEVAGEIVALVSPHAGYMYSGQVAACAYKLIQGLRFDAVAVVSPSHRIFFRGAAVYDRGGFETPLGTIPVETELSRKLLQENDLIRFHAKAHAEEHALEVQLPFLQEALGRFHLIPLVIGDQSLATCEAVGKALARCAEGKKILLVASTDLSHFHPYDEAVRLDRVFLEGLKSFDARKLQDDLSTGRTEACGGGPVIAVMTAAQELGADHAEVLKYLNSGDVTGDRSGVVGYAAAVFARNEDPRQRKEESKVSGEGMGLSEKEKQALREIARTSIECRLEGKRAAAAPGLTSLLKEKRGAFVSLHRRGRLRGCIGLIQANRPLHETVAEMAAAAAFEDPRFEPLSPEEIKDLEVEISVLTPLQEIEDINEIEVGRHGLYIKKGYQAGLLLPQVATEYKWTPKTFLEETCRKAGLARNAWKDEETKIYIFSADVF